MGNCLKSASEDDNISFLRENIETTPRESIDQVSVFFCLLIFSCFWLNITINERKKGLKETHESAVMWHWTSSYVNVKKLFGCLSRYVKCCSIHRCVTIRTLSNLIKLNGFLLQEFSRRCYFSVYQNESLYQ